MCRCEVHRGVVWASNVGMKMFMAPCAESFHRDVKSTGVKSPCTGLFAIEGPGMKSGLGTIYYYFPDFAYETKNLRQRMSAL